MGDSADARDIGASFDQKRASINQFLYTTSPGWN
jgi:hypothetical protein